MDQAWADGLRRRYFPPERNQLAAHLTMFHHLPPSCGDELDRRLAALCRGPAPAARVPGVRSLGKGVALAVESEELRAIRAELAEAFEGMLLPQDRQGWRPHITVQNKVEPAVARATQAGLVAVVRPRALRIAGLASWDYLGGPWRARSRFSFRG